MMRAGTVVRTPQGCVGLGAASVPRVLPRATRRAAAPAWAASPPRTAHHHVGRPRTAAAAGAASPAAAAMPSLAHGSGAAQMPLELPVFPVQPIGVFLPGMTKTLHLYEPHFVLLVEEAMARGDKLMATAVLEPFMGDGGADKERPSPGAFVGGNNFLLSCGCLVKVLSAKPYTGGYLVRIRGEGRLAIEGLQQTDPFMRAQVRGLPDTAVSPSLEQAAGLRRMYRELEEVMRDVQNLASKFRCDETAAIQQAMFWLNLQPVIQNIAPPEPPGVEGHQAVGAASSAAAAAAERLSGSHSSSSSNSSSSAGTSSTAHHHQSSSAHAAAQPADPDPAASQQEAAPSSSSSSGGGTIEEAQEEDDFTLERAARLSWAALQWLPQTTAEEKVYLVRSRLLAMDTTSVEVRLRLALDTMTAARDSLAAKCAIKGSGLQ